MSKRYIAAADIRIANLLDSKGQPRLFRGGDELVGVKPSTIANLLRLGHAREMAAEPVRAALPEVEKPAPAVSPAKAAAKK